MKWLKKCKTGSHYTLHEVCPEHGARAENPHPPKFDPTDKNGEARRKAKAEN